MIFGRVDKRLKAYKKKNMPELRSFINDITRERLVGWPNA